MAWCIDYIDYTSKQTYDTSMETVENNLQTFIIKRSNKFPQAFFLLHRTLFYFLA